MRILLLHEWGSGVAEARMWMYGRALQRQGHTVQMWPELDGSIWQHLEVNGGAWKWLHDNAHEYDVAVVQYSGDIDVAKHAMALREYANIPIILDVDDDPFNVPPYNLAFRAYHAGSQKRQVIKLLMHSAECVLASTRPLIDVIQRDCRKVFYAPNCLDTVVWEGLGVDPHRDEDKGVRVLFAGGQGRYGDLEVVKEALEWAVAKFPQMRLLWLGCGPDWAEKWMVNKADPRANNSFYVQGGPADIYRASLTWLKPDIWINPIADNKFNESKSCLKAWEAAMVGACYIGSDTLTHNPLPNDVMLKCATTYQWKESLEAAITDSALRQRLAKRLYDLAIKEWAVDGHVWRWLEAFDWAANHRVRQASDIVGLPSAQVAPQAT